MAHLADEEGEASGRRKDKKSRVKELRSQISMAQNKISTFSHVWGQIFRHANTLHCSYIYTMTVFIPRDYIKRKHGGVAPITKATRVRVLLGSVSYVSRVKLLVGSPVFRAFFPGSPVFLPLEKSPSF